MQSSTGVVLRAVVMLGCLVAIPLVALFGRSLPKFVDQVFAESNGQTEALGEAPRFEPLPTEAPGVLPDVPAKPMPAMAKSWSEAAAGQDNVLRADFNAAGGAAPAFSQHAPPQQPVQQPAVPPVDRFTYIQGRLRQLGATYYLLESWGDQQQVYRFYCRMAIGGDPNYTRNFQADKPDALEAMADVLAQAEAWVAGGRL